MTAEAPRDIGGEDTERWFREAVAELLGRDGYLLENDLSERCIAARLAMYLQPRFEAFIVDVEYNRDGRLPKMLNLPEECANYEDEEGRRLVVPDLIVHQRGPDGPNILVVEIKKTTNRRGRNCDRRRIEAFMREFGYTYGAFVEFETRAGERPDVRTLNWFVRNNGPA